MLVIENIDTIALGVISSTIFSLATYSVKSVLKMNNEKTEVNEEKITKKLSREIDVDGKKYTEQIKYEETHSTTKKRN